MKINFLLIFTLVTILGLFYKVYKIWHSLKKKEKIEFVNKKISNIYKNSHDLSEINYRVKWAMGKWFNTCKEIPITHKYYFSQKHLLTKDCYPEINHLIKKINNFLYDHGDVYYSVSCPCFTKTRPINDRDNIIIMLEFERHWGEVFNVKNKDIPFINKKAKIFWRGTTTGCQDLNFDRPGNRFNLVKKWYNKSNKIDIGFSFICQNKISYKKFVKNEKSINYMLKYKYLISAEGNDVASGLKWMLYSQSVVLMPKPTIVSWFMEDHLIPFKHYVPIKDDWSNLLEMYEWCENNQDKCQNIVKNANNYVQKFIDEFDNGLAGIIHDEIIRIYKNNINFIN